jgi:HPt (histidine-containing phosphotransfer) domain-containing protein
MEQIFNETEALGRLGDNRDLLLKISAYFVGYAKIQIDLLRDSFVCGDFSRMRSITHKLLGSIANFGANAAYSAGLKLQEALDRNDNDQIPELYRVYVSRIEKLRAELAEFSYGVEPPEINS